MLGMEHIMKDEKLAVSIENSTRGLKSNETIVHHGIVMEAILEDITFYAVNALLTVISAFLLYFLARKALWGTQDSYNRRKESHKHKRNSTCESDHPLNEDGSSMFSMFTYNWVEPLLQRGSSQAGLSSKDMFTIPSSLNVKVIQEQFSKLLQPEATKSNNKKPTLLQGLNKAYGRDFLLKCGLLELFAQVIDFTGPISLKMLISFFENQDEPAHIGYRYAFLLFLSSFGKTLLEYKFQFVRTRVIFKARISIMTTIYQKALRISTVSLSKFSTGEIVNFLGIDTDRLLRSIYRFHTLWSLPIEFFICVYILYQLVGIAFVGGMVVAMVIVPINKCISTKQMALVKIHMKQKDKRTKMMNEVLGGIKTIKLNTWEDHFRKVIDKLRDAELYTTREKQITSAFSVYVWVVTPALMTVLTFSIYTVMGNTLTTAKMFACLALFLKLLGSLSDIPWSISVITEALISLKRIEKFVALEDIDLNRYYEQKQESKKPDTVISVNAGTFTWEGENLKSSETKENEFGQLHRSVKTTTKSRTLSLRDITVDIIKGKFIGVIGKVGSGKSSFLNAIMAEMARKDGEISVSNIKNGFALADQEPWIQQATVRDNITFGSPFNAKKYAEVLDAASLKQDIDILPAGDRTEIGERGVTLSGGQKARLALARALYKDKDVYLLDDPLAAVDAHVAQHLYDKCIMGLLRTKTRILCTHHTKFLGEADLVIVINDGEISKMGIPADILDGIIFAEHKPSDKNAAEIGYTENNDKDGKMKEEAKATGGVKLRVYKTYLAALDKWVAPVILLCLFFMQAFQKMQNWWLAHWVNSTSINNTSTTVTGHLCFYDNMSTPNSADQGYDTTGTVTLGQPSLAYYMTVFVFLAGVYSLSAVTRELLFIYGGMSVAKTMHTNLLKTILKAPMSFYDVTPVGRILNRFSSDMDTIDDTISNTIKMSIAKSFNIAGSVLIACYGMPWFILLLLPVAFFYYRIQGRYRQTSREVRRILSLNRSPIFSHFSETVSGVVTIRAFRQTERFKDQHVDRVHNWLRAYYTSHNIGLWFLFRTQVIGTVIVTGIALLAVIQHNIFRIEPGVAGLAISYTLALSLHLNRIVNSVTEMENGMVSVERVQQYIDDTPSERWEGLEPSPAWPATGVISYSDVHMKYRDGLPNVLKGLTFSTRHAEKVGIVGRTGAGKSSLFQTLFRIVEISSGDITIDGVNIQQLDLKDVRRHLAVIPQDPFLFSGTVRENLDPTSCYSDEELWGVLDKCHLRLTVDRLGGLGGEVTEKGRCFSVGQKQLVCLARALLTKAKVLCIDEATASVDLETDMLIQETIRQEFVDSTVLTIAHRINTIMDSDRVLVMDQGQVAELDSPETLLKNPKSAFYKLVHGDSRKTE